MGKLFYTTYTESELKSLFAEIIQPLITSEIQKIIASPNNSPPKESDTYLTRKETCQLLHLSLPTLTKLSKEGKLKAKVVGGSYRYSRQQVEKYMSGGNRN